MALYSKTADGPKRTYKKTSIGDGRRKEGSFKSRGKKAYRGQGKR